jgi:hypothetical protein
VRDQAGIAIVRLIHEYPSTASSIYPLLSLDSTAGRELLRTVRAELREHGCAVLPQFLHSDACAAGVAECEAGRANGDVFSKLRRHNVFMSAADPSLPPEHPVHRMQERTQGYIAHDQLAASIFRTLYEWEPLTTFVCEATSKRLYRSADPIACAPISVMTAGQKFPWHYDENDVTLTLMLQPAASGGVFEFCPALRTATDERPAVVSAVLDGDRTHVRASLLGAGELQLFHGQHSLHRVTAVGEGSHPRYLVRGATVQTLLDLSAVLSSPWFAPPPPVRARLERPAGVGQHARAVGDVVRARARRALREGARRGARGAAWVTRNANGKWQVRKMGSADPTPHLFRTLSHPQRDRDDASSPRPPLRPRLGRERGDTTSHPLMHPLPLRSRRTVATALWSLPARLARRSCACECVGSVCLFVGSGCKNPPL